MFANNYIFNKKIRFFFYFLFLNIMEKRDDGHCIDQIIKDTQLVWSVLFFYFGNFIKLFT